MHSFDAPTLLLEQFFQLPFGVRRQQMIALRRYDKRVSVVQNPAGIDKSR